jgi:hypothetical protein
MPYSEKISELFSKQLKEWKLAKDNYCQLDKVKIKRLNFCDFEMLVQFNPERIRSSAARVDAKSIEKRPCFLCAKNRPHEQKGITSVNGLTILVNPFPIFSRHLTIPSEEHSDQRISPNFNNLLLLARSLSGYTVFYNGPQSGASAPDHFHFQAGERGAMPIENDFLNKRHCKLLSDRSGLEIWLWENYLRGIVTLKATEDSSLSGFFNHFYDKLSELQSDKPEPMLNILAYEDSGSIIVHIIPRRLHRPVQYFLEGKDQILLSPGAVDLAGLIITPREEDFRKLTENDIEDIFRQVCISQNDLSKILSEII